MSTLARWCRRHRLVVVVTWLVLLIGLGGLSKSAYKDSFSLPNTDSTRAMNLLTSAFPAQAGDSDTVVWHVSSGSVRDGAVEQRMTQTLDTITHLPEVASVTGPYTPTGAARISADGKTAYATVTFTQNAQHVAKADVQKVVDTAHAAATGTLEVEMGGSAVQQTEQTSTSSSELIGVLAAAVVLFIAFGSFLAMLMPIVTAIAGVGSSIMVVGLLSHLITIASLAPTLGALIGLGVGIDYALFIVTRFRRGLQSGMSVDDALVIAVNTSGRAVLFAGATVCIALLGMLVLGVSFLNGVAIGASVTVVFTVIAAITLLPALLSFLGDRVLGRRQRKRLRAGENPLDLAKRGVWARWADTVQRRPKVLAAAALLVMLVLSIPTLSLRLGSSDQGNDPSSSTTRKAYDLLAEGFGPGFNGPLTLVAQAPTAADHTALASLAQQIKAVDGVAGVFAAPMKPGATVGIVTVTPTSSPESKQTSELIDRLRAQVIPKAEAGTTLHVYVGGQTAIFKDFAGVLSGKLPLFITVIVGLGFLLLVVAFRSLLVPLTAAIMNLLAAAASFGVIVAFFEWGWGSDALGLGKAGPIEAFIPVMMLSILFGLSMDYQVFLVSRMNEEWVHTRDNARSVRVGQVETSRVITSAATIMICVFVAFALGGERTIGEFGIGLSAAVLLDAFLLRTVLVPAAMHVFGDANWWLPRWLDRRLPHLAIEPPEALETVQRQEAVEADGPAETGRIPAQAAHDGRERAGDEMPV
jgi:RND superfamily putative drug exporter